MSNYAKYKDLGGETSSVIPQKELPPQQQINVEEIESLEHKKFLINNNRICVVYIHGSWCQPCKSIAPRYIQLIGKYNRQGLCALVKEDVDKGLSNCRGVPTFQFFKEGNYLNQDIVGADIASVEKKIVELLSS
jgi:thiol-disulfide isomerase/thioredoxin